MPDAARWRLAIVPAAFLLLALLTFRQFGMTWDESVQSRYGELAVDYFASGGRDTRVNELRDLRLYGPLFETAAAAAYRGAPQVKVEIRHLLIALTAVAAVAGIGLFAAEVGVSGVVAQLLLLLNPQFFGHSFNNSKDIPLAAAAVWSMLFAARMLRSDKPRLRDAALLGVALGCALGIRIGGGVVMIAIAAGVAILMRRWRALPALAASAVLGWLIMIAVWPWAQQHPIASPLEALRASRAFPVVYPMLFEGQTILSSAVPRRYLAEMFAITTPVLTLALAITGIAFAVRRRTEADVLAVCWLAIPLVAFSIVRPNVYDGIRHFLFLVPAIAVLAACGVASMPRWRLLAVVAAAAIPLVAMVRLHPYEAAYYNALVGGTRGASKSFETDYWASSYREAALWLDEHRCGTRPTRVLVAATPLSKECLTHYLDPRRFAVARTVDTNVRTPLPEAFDYYVATTRYGWSQNFEPTPAAHVIGRTGAVFTVIRGRCGVR